MKKLITNFQQIGVCEVDVDKVVKAWTDKFMISQYHDDYTLVKFSRGANKVQVKISKKQAEEIISKLNLCTIKSTMLVYGKTYRTKPYIVSEINRLLKLTEEKENELNILNGCIYEFQKAIKEL